MTVAAKTSSEGRQPATSGPTTANGVLRTFTDDNTMWTEAGMTTRCALGAGAAVAITIAIAAPAQATTTWSQHEHAVSYVDRVNDPGSENDLAPCFTAPGTIAGTTNSTDHVVQQDGGGTHTVHNETGTMTLTPDDTSLPVYNGRYVLHFTDTAVAGEVAGFEANFELRAASGEVIRLHLNGQFRVLPDGELQRMTVHLTCGSGP
jgi:hypothetical protein